jgi:hypothetical protein
MKRKLKRLCWQFFTVQIDERRIEESKQRYLELQLKSGCGPY